MLQQIPHVSAKGGAPPEPVFPISYSVFGMDCHYCLRTPTTLGRFRTDYGKEEVREAPSARKTAVGSLYHFLNACCTPQTEHGLQQVRHWKSSLGQIVNYSICVCVYKNPFSPRSPGLRSRFPLFHKSERKINSGRGFRGPRHHGGSPSLIRAPIKRWDFCTSHNSRRGVRRAVITETARQIIRAGCLTRRESCGSARV